MQSSGFLVRLIGPLLKTGLPIMKNLLKQLAKSVRIPLRLKATTLAADAGIHKKIIGSGTRPWYLPQERTLITLNEKADCIIK